MLGEAGRCNVCNRHAKKMERKDDFRGQRVVKKDEKAFQDFLRMELNEEGKVKKVLQEADGAADETESVDDQRIDYLRDLKREKKDIIKPKDEYVFLPRSFNWFMEKLISPSERISGCEVSIPDMVLFEHGRPKFFLKNERDGCIAHIMRAKSHITDVKNYFMQLCNERNRMREQEGVEAMPILQNKADSPPYKNDQSAGVASPAGKLDRTNTNASFLDASAVRSQSDPQNSPAGQNRAQTSNNKGTKAAAGSSQADFKNRLGKARA